MDDDDKKSEDAAAEPAPDAAQEEGAKLREVSEDELEQILAAHKMWLETGGEQGKQADLSRADLHGASLGGAKFQEANLGGAELQGAYLNDANLQRANLRGADLWGANLQGAILSSANLTEAKHLTREQLDKACGDGETKLPDYLADYKMKECPKPEQPPSN